MWCGISFTELSQVNVKNMLKALDTRKSTGNDGIPAELLCAAADELADPISKLVIESIKQSAFPNPLKEAQVSPIHKPGDSLLWDKYQPVSILKCLSKFFERTYHDQLYEYFEHIMSGYLAAFRKRYGCNHVLLKLMKNGKRL